MNDKMIVFNQYVKIPKDYYLDFEHNYVDDILTIHLKNNQTITITNFTFEDFNKISETKLQSNWNSLREWLERMIQKFIDIDNLDYVTFQVVRDKMNELERKDK